ncbi:MAG: DUF4270 family protein, partial [Bacteroidales bacterium]
ISLKKFKAFFYETPKTDIYDKDDHSVMIGSYNDKDLGYTRCEILTRFYFENIFTDASAFDNVFEVTLELDQKIEDNFQYYGFGNHYSLVPQTIHVAELEEPIKKEYYNNLTYNPANFKQKLLTSVQFNPQKHQPDQEQYPQKLSIPLPESFWRPLINSIKSFYTKSEGPEHHDTLLANIFKGLRIYTDKQDLDLIRYNDSLYLVFKYNDIGGTKLFTFRSFYAYTANSTNEKHNPPFPLQYIEHDYPATIKSMFNDDNVNRFFVRPLVGLRTNIQIPELSSYYGSNKLINFVRLSLPFKDDDLYVPPGKNSWEAPLYLQIYNKASQKTIYITKAEMIDSTDTYNFYITALVSNIVMKNINPEDLVFTLRFYERSNMTANRVEVPDVSKIRCYIYYTNY